MEINSKLNRVGIDAQRANHIENDDRADQSKKFKKKKFIS
jgi:hypothetical protein